MSDNQPEIFANTHDLLRHLQSEGEAYVPDLVTRAISLRPPHLITIKANVCDLTQKPLCDAGLDVIDQRVPFPGSGQQRRFLETMSAALDSIGWHGGASLR